MIISPFVSKIQINETTTALFHSLTMDVMYINNEIIKDKDIFSTLKNLYDNKEFIVSDEFAPMEYLEECTSKLTENVFDFTTLKMFITTECNLDCSYCLIKKNIEQRGQKAEYLTYEVGKKTLEFFSKLALMGEKRRRTIMLYGGEPLLNWDTLKKIIIEARRLEDNNKFNGELEIVLETNGVMINEEISQFLNKYNIFTIVSLDGTKEIHDYYRVTKDGEASWDAAAKGYNLLKDIGCSVVISSVFTNKFASNYQEAIDNLCNEFQPYSIGLNLFHVLDGQDIIDDNTVNVIDKYVESWESAKDKGLYVEHIMRRIRPLVEKKIRLKDCGACGNRIVSDCEGKIGICEGFVGNDTYFKYREEYLDVIEDQTFIDWSKRTQLLMDECLGCCAQGICGGGCAYNGLIINSSIYRPDPYICSASKALVNWSLRTWFKHSDVKLRLKDCGYTWLKEEERIVILGLTPLHPNIPLQSISKERELKI